MMHDLLVKDLQSLVAKVLKEVGTKIVECLKKAANENANKIEFQDTLEGGVLRMSGKVWT